MQSAIAIQPPAPKEGTDGNTISNIPCLTWSERRRELDWLKTDEGGGMPLKEEIGFVGTRVILLCWGKQISIKIFSRLDPLFRDHYFP